MELPIVTIDLTDHPVYSSGEYHSHLCDVFTAELTMINTNKGTIRCRLFNEKGECVCKNLDLSSEYIVNRNILIKV